MPVKARSFRPTCPGPVGLTGARVAGLLVGVLACHLLFLGPLTALIFEPPAWLEEVGLQWGNRLEAETKAVWFAAAVLLSAALVAAALWRLVRISQRPAGVAAFVFCWWRASVFGAIVLMLFLAVTMPWLGPAEENVIQWTGVVLPVYLAIAPAALSPYLLPMRLHWRPECPECGHTLKYAAGPRCSECGEPFPCPDRFYRRWAIRRLPWDRRRRALVAAYVRTMLCILFRPDMAAWRLANPDRYGRAVRWALGHALLPGLIAGAVWLGVAVVPRLDRQVISEPRLPSVDGERWRVSPVVHTAVARGLAAVVFPVALGLLLAWALPAARPAARLGVIKWSFYAIAAPMTVVIPFAVCAGAYWTAITTGLLQNRVEWLEWLRGFERTPEQVVSLVIVLYAGWWAIGVASQPHLHRRGVAVFLVALAAYLATWRVLLWLFDLRGFEGIL